MHSLEVSRRGGHSWKRALAPLSFLLIAALGGVACNKDEPPPPKPEPSDSAKAASTKPKGNSRASSATRIDPQIMKEYRLDVCYFGTFSIQQARETYLASLGKDEPSEKHLPTFGAPPTPATATPHASSSAEAGEAKKAKGKKAEKAGEKGEKSEKAAESGTAKTPDSSGRPHHDRRPDFARAPHERNARACTAAVGLKEPAMGDVDTALAAYATYIVDLAKDISAATNYYGREEYKKDSFEKGKALHKKLTENFPKYDELHDKLGTALAAWRKEHPQDSSKWDDAHKKGAAALSDARDAITALTAKKPDAAGFKSAVEKLETSTTALKAGADGANDTWGKMLGTPLDAFIKMSKENESKITEKGVEGEAFSQLVAGFVAVVEGRQRALGRSMARPGGLPGMIRPPGGPRPPGAATGSPGPDPHP